MLEALQVIALLCQVHPAVSTLSHPASINSVQKAQEKCHREYLECMGDGHDLLGTKLVRCIKERK